MKRCWIVGLLFVIIIMFKSCVNIGTKYEEEMISSYEKVLYVPTMINKIDDTYFIIDCWQHRVLYNTELDKDLTKWKTMTDESYIAGHTIASDGEFYLLDNTDGGQVLAYKKTENGDFEKVITFQTGGESARPHYVVYDEINKLFYAIGSMDGTIYVFENQSGTLVLQRRNQLSELVGGYVRSISIIDGCLYTVSGNSIICKYDITREGFTLNATYQVPDEFVGMNQIVKIRDYFYITINTDINGDVSKTNIVRVKDLNQLAKGEYESLYDSMGFVGQPYFITYFDEKYYIAQISATKGNGIKSFEVIDNEIKNVTDIFYWEEVLEDSINRYESKYALKEENVQEKEVVDLFLFCGQSNMSGKGNAKQAPYVEHGYEFRAVTNPNALYNIFEPFGINQINQNGINDSWPTTGELRKRGGLVSAFANSYYDNTGTAIVGVSCSEGATTISQWMPGTDKYEDIVNRCNLAKAYLQNSSSYELRYVYMVWCQGESDGDVGTTYESYYDSLNQITNSLVEQGVVDKCMIIKTGDYADNIELYDHIQLAQEDLCQENDNCILISDLAPSFVEKGLMLDVYHYTQEGYNILGEDAGKNAAEYTQSLGGEQ